MPTKHAPEELMQSDVKERDVVEIRDGSNIWLRTVNEWRSKSV